MRYVFGRIISEMADKDDKLIVLTGDIGYGVFDDFREKYPERWFNMGILEQSLISISAGMALEGLHPIVYTITPYIIERAFEQVKLDIDENNANVKLVGYADYPELGITHQEILTPNILNVNKIFKNIKCYKINDDKSLCGKARAERELRRYLSSEGPIFLSLKKSQGELK